MAKEFKGVRCRIDFVRGQTLYDGSNRRLDRYVENRGCAVGAQSVVTPLGNGVSVQENFVSGNNRKGALSGKE